MKKLFLLSITSLALAGCVSKPPMKFTNDSFNASESQVRNTLIKVAAEHNWNICQEEGNKLRADLIYKKWKIYADISYGENYYSITPNIKYTTLAEDNGTVHRAVNNLTKRLAGYARRDFTYANPRVEKPITIPQCVAYDYIDVDELGIIFTSKSYLTTGFTWVNKPEDNLKSPMFKVRVLPAQNIAREHFESMHMRMQEYLDKRGMYSKPGESGYMIEVKFVASKVHTKGGVKDFVNFADSHEQLQAVATIKDEQGQTICIIDSSTRVDTSGWTGVINKATNKVTAALTTGILDSIEKHLINMK